MNCCLKKSFLYLISIPDIQWNELCFKCQKNSKLYWDSMGYSAKEDEANAELELLKEGDLEEGELEEGELEEDEMEGELEEVDDPITWIEPITGVALHYLTPGMMEMFRASEVWRMSQKEAINAKAIDEPLEDPVELDSLSLELQARFNAFVEEKKPVFWPVLSMRF
jgi:hypothetical protein